MSQVLAHQRQPHPSMLCSMKMSLIINNTQVDLLSKVVFPLNLDSY